MKRTAYNEIMVIDGNEVLTCLFNFTRAQEEHNAENLLVILRSGHFEFICAKVAVAVTSLWLQ